MGADWSNIEVELIIADYLAMLSDELKGNTFNKTTHRKELHKLLTNRSEGSIEFKHQNISAAMIKLGLPYIRGYKPRWNYQHILDEKVVEVIETTKTKLEPLFINFADAVPSVISSEINFNSILEQPPEIKHVAAPEINYVRKPIKINYLEREQRNLSLGNRGEEFVFKYEKWRLIHEGKSSFADQIEWVSKSDDGAGFDILSKNKNGTDRFIEVKTTKLSKDTPIFFSKNELEFSQQKTNNYFLYRLFNFESLPKMFYVNGDFDSFCTKDAIAFKGYF